jgi:hypothetical protein
VRDPPPRGAAQGLDALDALDADWDDAALAADEAPADVEDEELDGPACVTTFAFLSGRYSGPFWPHPVVAASAATISTGTA